MYSSVQKVGLMKKKTVKADKAPHIQSTQQRHLTTPL